MAMEANAHPIAPKALAPRCRHTAAVLRATDGTVTCVDCGATFTAPTAADYYARYQGEKP